MPRGGKRENAGRPTLEESKKRKQYAYYLTDYEKTKMDEYLKQIRSEV